MALMPVTIRSAVLDDLPALLAIEQASAHAAHWTREQYQRRVAEGAVLVSVSEEPRSIGGFVCARVAAGEWEIENIVVADKLQRRGIADALLGELLRQAREMGGTAVWLEVRESNIPARRLYEKHKFRESGRRRRYYKNPVEDAVTYGLALG